MGSGSTYNNRSTIGGKGGSQQPAPPASPPSGQTIFYNPNSDTYNPNSPLGFRTQAEQIAHFRSLPVTSGGRQMTFGEWIAEDAKQVAANLRGLTPEQRADPKLFSYAVSMHGSPGFSFNNVAQQNQFQPQSTYIDPYSQPFYGSFVSDPYAGAFQPFTGSYAYQQPTYYRPPQQSFYSPSQQFYSPPQQYYSPYVNQFQMAGGQFYQQPYSYQPQAPFMQPGGRAQYFAQRNMGKGGFY